MLYSLSTVEFSNWCVDGLSQSCFSFEMSGNKITWPGLGIVRGLRVFYDDIIGWLIKECLCWNSQGSQEPREPWPDSLCHLISLVIVIPIFQDCFLLNCAAIAGWRHHKNTISSSSSEEWRGKERSFSRGLVNQRGNCGNWLLLSKVTVSFSN